MLQKKQIFRKKLLWIWSFESDNFRLPKILFKSIIVVLFHKTRQLFLTSGSYLKIFLGSNYRIGKKRENKLMNFVKLNDLVLLLLVVVIEIYEINKLINIVFVCFYYLSKKRMKVVIIIVFKLVWGINI